MTSKQLTVTKFLITSLLLAMTAAAALSATAGPARAAFPGDNGKIAFVSASDIYAMNSDGSGKTQLTTDEGHDFDGTWSPDGTRVAFTRLLGYGPDGERNYEIYTMNADGSEQKRLTNNKATDFQPAWSPDGKKIVFASSRNGGSYDIYTMNVDGSKPKKLTNDEAVDSHPAWSPNGKKIAFSKSAGDGNSEIYMMNANGTGQTKLTDTPDQDDTPVWSPNGKKIAFSSRSSEEVRPNGPPAPEAIYTVNANGTGLKKLSGNSATDTGPSWSPDGTKIAFTKLQWSYSTGPRNDVYTMNADGSAQQGITADTARVEEGTDWGSSS